MSYPMNSQIQTASLNPIENIITSVNSNPYFIGFMMLLLNLGGRHLATGLTPEQDKFFQHPWFRRALIFIVFFIGTRNIVSSFFMGITFILVIGYLFNDQSQLYIFNPSVKIKGDDKKDEKEVPSSNGLTPEEQEIHKRLSDKIQRTSKPVVEDETDTNENNIAIQITEIYSNIMSRF